jgi:WD40 repeat protein
LGHSGVVYSVAVSPDGKRVLTGSGDNTAKLWDLATGRELRTFEGHTGQVTAVAFSPDGKQVLTGSRDKTARLWDATTGRESLLFQGHAGWLSSVAFSPDGKRVLTGGADRTARLWDAATAKEALRLLGHTSQVTSVAFSPDGRRAATGSWDNTARVWDAAGGNVLHVLRGHVNYVTSVTFSPDGKQLLTGCVDGAVRFWDVGSGRALRGSRVNDNGITSLAISPDGNLLLAGREGNNARVWNAVTGRALRDLTGHGPRPVGVAPSGGALEQGLSGVVKDRVEGVTFSPDSRLALTGADDWTARLWDAATGREMRTFQGRIDKVTSVAFSPDGKQALTAAGLSARLWDAVGARQIRAFGAPDAPPWPFAVLSVAFSPGGKQVLTGNRDNTARLWDAASGKQINVFRWPRKAFNYAYNYDSTPVAFSPDGRRVLAASDEASLWDAASGKKALTFQGEAGVSAVAFSPDGRRVVTAGADTRMTRYELQDNQLTVRGAVDTTAHLLDAASGREIGAFKGHTGGLSSVAFSPDGKQVLTASDDKTARLWDATTREEIRAFRGHTDKVKSAAFSWDGKQVLTGGNDWTARLWDAGTGKELRAFRGHTGGVTSVAISPDGKRVLTGSWDGTARLWDAGSGRELCSWISFRDGSWVAVTPERYYMASRGALEGVAFRVGDRAFPFHQFDLKFNRPDRVIARLGLAPRDMIAAYGHAYQKRLKRMNVTEAMLGDEFHVPEVAVESAVKFGTREKTLKLKVRAGDSKYLLDRLNIDVNGVPCRGIGGIDLRKQASKSWEQEIELELSAGGNKIEVSALNEKGAESLKDTLTIQCNAPAGRPNLYVVAVGVSDYRDARFRLDYADKDARDLADLLEGKRDRFGDVKVLRILNRDGTRENVLKARDFLKGARVDDQVVVFFAGHGLLDSKLDYYFATADTDFSDPAKRGLPYEAVEDLLDGTRARKKLLLMDTCHSGELDKEDVRADRSEGVPEGRIKTRSFRSGLTRLSPKVGLGNSYQLLQEMFADLRRGTGAAVIASAGGAEYALESATWKNGVFTHALLRGLKGEADKNRDGRVQVSELRDFVEQEVRRLTGGQQTPTARRENLELDFTVVELGP